MTVLAPLELAEKDKLQVLQRLDKFRTWRSLDEKRYCLVCGKVISGEQIQVIGGTRGNEPLRVICPTYGCHSIPMDWVLPTAEVLADITMEKAARADPHAVRQDHDAQKEPTGSVLRQLAAWLKRPA
jgi:hypothetical protein